MHQNRTLQLLHLHPLGLHLSPPPLIDVGHLGGQGRTALQVATMYSEDDVAALLQELSLQ